VEIEVDMKQVMVERVIAILKWEIARELKFIEKHFGVNQLYPILKKD